MKSRTLTNILMCSICGLLLALPILATSAAGADRPNIVVILVDDMGYSDLGCYGGEIETPRLDALASQGLRFSQFYNTAKCHSSRVSLLTGQYCIAAGNTAMSHAVTSADVLRQAGYFTAMTGKWHLKKEPTDFGFDRYFGHLSGACNYFKGDKTFRLNGRSWQVPDSNFYTTVANVDYALKFLNEARAGKQPWYLYVAFNAPHAPLHALPEDYAKYKGKYDAGWDAIRAARANRQKELGLLPNSLKPSPRPEHIPAWKDMEPWRQKYEANRMTTLAAMIDRVDQEVGRLVDDLKAHDELDNTLILFVSDNGACPYDRHRPLLDAEPTNGNTFLGDSTGWAWARNTPFRYYKQNQFEGGISTPAIVHWPAGLKTQPGSINHQPAHLIDVLPTLVEASQSSIPTQWPGRDLRPVSGISLSPVFRGETLHRDEPIHLLFSNDRGLRDGDWKAVSFRREAWELYNMANDRTELENLADENPDRLKSMIDEWTRMTRDVLHARPKTYAPATPAQAEHLHPEWTHFDGMEPNRQAKARAGTANRSRAGGQPPLAVAERENFVVANHQAFVSEPPKSAQLNAPMPWVWYAPTFAGRLPGPEEDWMIKRFHDRGIAIAGIDVGESYGSPAGRAVYQSLYEELTSKRGYSKQPVLLARSRGGLMLYNWAAEHPNSVGGIAGIYPVCNIESYPGLAQASAAYEMTAEQLKAKLDEHNPINRLAPLAKAKVPILHIHGDQDQTVPLEENSAKLASHYRELGGPVEIDVIKGQGHNMWEGWFQSQKLTDFIVSRALAATTNAEVDPPLSKAAESLIASITKETLWRNRDGQSRTWFHPRVCMMPDTDNKPVALMTLQEIGGSDYFGQVHWSVSKDLGHTWTDPVPIPALGREDVPGHEGLKAAVCDVTPQYHPQSKQVIALGHVVFYKGNYFANDEQLPRYPIYALRSSDGHWSKRQILEWEDPRGAFIYSNNCGQRVVLPNGDVQMSFTFGPQPMQRMVSGVRAGFDGERLTVKQVGPPLNNPNGRGLLEPSVTQFGDKFWITIRAEDGRGYLSRSNDGLHWEPKRAWSWEDGAPLQMSTTQQHWLTHSDGLFLIYTRRDDSNENVIRWRSPLWVAQVDTDGMCLIKHTERIVLPIVGDGVNEPDKVALMGNFNVTNVNQHESLVTVGEWMPRDGYRGDLLLARIRWSKPNRLPLW